MESTATATAAAAYPLHTTPFHLRNLSTSSSQVRYFSLFYNLFSFDDFNILRLLLLLKIMCKFD